MHDCVQFTAFLRLQLTVTIKTTCDYKQQTTGHKNNTLPTQYPQYTILHGVKHYTIIIDYRIPIDEL